MSLFLKVLAAVKKFLLQSYTWLLDQVTAEKIVITAVVGNEKYVCVKPYRRWLLQNKKRQVKKKLASFGAVPPIEFDVRPAKGAGTHPKTCFVFWIADQNVLQKTKKLHYHH